MVVFPTHRIVSHIFFKLFIKTADRNIVSSRGLLFHMSDDNIATLESLSRLNYTIFIKLLCV